MNGDLSIDALQERTVTRLDMPDGPLYLTVQETASRIGYSRWTIYHWISSGRLNQERGLRKNRRSCRIEWAVFKPCFDRGEIT